MRARNIPAMLLAAASLTFSPGMAAAGPADDDEPRLDFSGLSARPGDTLIVALPSGVEVRGRLTEVSRARLVIDGYVFHPEPGLSIYRHGDTVLDGAGVGFLAGMLASLTVSAEACLGRSDLRCVAQGGLTGAALGALLDWAHVGRTRILRIEDGASVRELRVGPAIGRHRVGIALTLRY